MGKSRTAHKINDQVLPTESYGKPNATTAVLASSASIASPETPCRTSYIPGVKPEEEPTEIPRLFVRGLGGSVKMDLSGLGIKLLPDALMFRLSDESLHQFGLHRDDIAIVQPIHRAVHDGDILMLELDGLDVLRVVTSRGEIRGLGALDGSDFDWVPLYGVPLQGIVIGFLRMFEAVTPVRFRLPPNALLPPRERSHIGKPAVKPLRKPKRRISYAEAKSGFTDLEKRLLGLVPAGPKALRLRDGEDNNSHSI